jgi:hypothetical protein
MRSEQFPPSVLKGWLIKMTSARALVDNFQDFMQSHGLLEPTGPLQYYILEWLEHGDAVIESGGDFGTYMQGVVYIIAKWMEDPSILGYTAGKNSVQRQATGVLDPSYGEADSFDRDYFRTILFRRLLRSE